MSTLQNKIMSKKVLLINPSFPEGTTIFNMPVSILYLGSWLVNNGYEVYLLDALHFKDMSLLFQRIESELSDVLCVGLSVMSAQIPSALQISRFVRQCDSSIPIIWGGVHPTLYPEQTAKSEFVDFAVKGEGELTLSELLGAVKQGDLQPANIKGLAFRGGDNNVTLTPDREPLDVNELPSIDWRLLEGVRPDRSLKEMSRLAEYGLPLLISKGCPHRCTFCINSILKTRYRHRRTDLVLSDIKRAVALGAERIWFVDEDFFANRSKIRELIDGIEDEGLNFSWFANVRADYFHPDYLGSEEFLLRVKRSGCEILGLGAESGSPRVLDILEKDITIEDTLNAARCLSRAGIKASFSFMIGLPGERESDYKQTLQLIDEIIKIDYSFFILGPQIYRPYPGSQLYLECVRRGLKEPNAIDEWASSPYIREEYPPKNYYDRSLYPWVEYPGDLSNLVFYALLSGVRPRWKPVTKLLRFIGGIRCRRYCFKYPIAKRVYGLLGGTRAESFLRRRGII